MLAFRVTISGIQEPYYIGVSTFLSSVAGFGTPTLEAIPEGV